MVSQDVLTVVVSFVDVQCTVTLIYVKWLKKIPRLLKEVRLMLYWCYFKPTFPLQAPLPAPSSPGGGGGRGEEHYEQCLLREPQPGSGGWRRSLFTPAATALCRGGGRRGLLWAVGRSEPGQHHGFGLGHLLLPLLSVPRQRGSLWEQQLCLPGQWKQVSKRDEMGLACISLCVFFVVSVRDGKDPGIQGDILKGGFHWFYISNSVHWSQEHDWAFDNNCVKGFVAK